RQAEKDVILKIGVPNPELASEMNTLRLFNGEGACQLLGCDEEKGFLLIERLKPGTMLADLQDDDERTHIAIDVMQKIWRPVDSGSLPLAREQSPTLHRFIQLTDWFAELESIRPQFNGGTGPFPRKIFERVEAALPELFADDNVRLIHGDFHHFNILSSDRGWLVIDPKGVIGPVGYEIGPLMINPWGSLMDRISFKVQTERRVNILSERLGWEREKIIAWALAHSVLSAWWDYPSGDWKYSLGCAQAFSEIIMKQPPAREVVFR
ncbi:MAG: phosphotransferase, partial [Anaerolineales bacterium]|nr:phosphotransferase [Anaerolineales bacterium]